MQDLLAPDSQAIESLDTQDVPQHAESGAAPLNIEDSYQLSGEVTFLMIITNE